jgi:predicted acyltransferase
LNAPPPAIRWDALDVFRGLTIMLMLLNLSPGSWELNYSWLVHAKWEGWTLIDMVAPAFLFCIGAAMPLSFARRVAKGATRDELLRHVLWRGLLLVLIGFFLNLYPTFDFAHVRIPGVLQRIGLCYAISGAFIVLTARRATSGALKLRTGLIVFAAVFVLLSYWALLYFVPVPGFGAPRFDAVGSWPSVVDRAVIGVDHFFPHWTVDGKVVFDPEGILSTWPACFNILLGVLTGLAQARSSQPRAAWLVVASGAALIVAAYLVQGVCPIIKNIWTSSFALFSGGFSLVLLGLLMPVTRLPGVNAALAPARIFGENPLLAYILTFLLAPLVDMVRAPGQAWLVQFLEPRAASLLFGLVFLLLLLMLLIVCHRRRWILKL